MDEARTRAYRMLLAQGLLHLKWDLARFYDGLSLTRPWQLLRESRSVRTAAFRAFAFHNLAISAAADFVGFSEEACIGAVATVTCGVYVRGVRRLVSLCSCRACTLRHRGNGTRLSAPSRDWYRHSAGGAEPSRVRVEGGQ